MRWHHPFAPVVLGLAWAWVAAAARSDESALPPGATARLGNLRFWHGAPILSVALSPDGKLAATGGGWVHRRTSLSQSRGNADGWIRVWETATARQIHALNVRGQLVRGLAFSPDGKVLGAAYGQEIGLWQVASGKLVHKLTGQGAPIACMSFSTDGRRLFSAAANTLIHSPDCADDTEVAWWDVATAQKKRFWMPPPAIVNTPVRESPYRLSLSPDGKLLVRRMTRWLRKDSGGLEAEHHLQGWDVAAGKLLYDWAQDGNDYNYGAIFFSRDGRRLVLAGNSLREVDPSTGKVLRTFKDIEAHALALSPDGRQLASTNLAGRLQLGPFAEGKKPAELLPTSSDRWTMTPADDEQGTPLAFSADGRLLAFADGATLRLFDGRSGKERSRVSGDHSPILSARFSPHGRFVITATGRALSQWDRATAKETGRQPIKVTLPGEVSPDGTTVLTKLPKDAWQMRNGADGKVHCVLSVEETSVRPGGFSPDGRTVLLVAAEKNQIRGHVFAVPTGKRLARVILVNDPRDNDIRQKLGNWGFQSALAPGGRLLAWMEAGGRLQLVDLPSGKVRRELARPADESILRPNLVLFSPDGRLLATSVCPEAGPGSDYAGSDHEGMVVSLWETASGRLLQRMRFPWETTERTFLSCLAFSPDGRTLVAATHSNGPVRLFETASGRQRRTFAGHKTSVRDLAFAADGKVLASAGADGLVLLWDTWSAQKAAEVAPEALWAGLASTDAEHADRAIRALQQSPAQSVPLLHGRLRPAVGADPARIQELVAALGNGRFARRQQATRELEQLGEQAGTTLRQALAKTIGLEARRRLERLLATIDNATPPPGRLRELRALEVLEHIGNPEARGLLHVLARGDPGCRLTCEAQAALRRLRTR